MATAQVELNDVAKALIDGTLTAFKSNKGWADKAVAQVSDDKLHVALDPNTNCIAVIMKHVAGNLLSRWTDFLNPVSRAVRASCSAAAPCPSSSAMEARRRSRSMWNAPK